MSTARVIVSFSLSLSLRARRDFTVWSGSAVIALRARSSVSAFLKFASMVAKDSALLVTVLTFVQRFDFLKGVLDGFVGNRLGFCGILELLLVKAPGRLHGLKSSIDLCL